MVMKHNTYRWTVLLWVLIHSTLSFAYDVGISPTASDFSEDKSIHATASHEFKGSPLGMDNQLFVSTYMLQLPDKATLERFLEEEIKEKRRQYE